MPYNVPDNWWVKFPVSATSFVGVGTFWRTHPFKGCPNILQTQSYSSMYGDQIQTFYVVNPYQKLTPKIAMLSISIKWHDIWKVPFAWNSYNNINLLGHKKIRNQSLSWRCRYWRGIVDQSVRSQSCREFNYASILAIILKKTCTYRRNLANSTSLPITSTRHCNIPVLASNDERKGEFDGVGVTWRDANNN